jgi:hypothetical protein
MVSDPEDGGDPRVTVRVPENDIEVVRAVAGDEDHDYSMGHVIRYSMDRKFEGRVDVDWESGTEHDPELESLIDTYREELGYGEEDDGEVDMEGVDVMLGGEEELRENSMEYALKMYAIGAEKGDETIKELSRQYLQENFPEDDLVQNYFNE